MPAQQLSSDAYDCLRHAVTLAKGEAIKSRGSLRKRLKEAGWSSATIDEAMSTWAGSVVDRLLPETE